MPEAELRHEVVKEDGTGLPLLHVYLPESLAFSDVAVTTGSSPHVAEVFIEHVATERVLGLIELQGYTVAQDDAVAKFNKKHRRYAIRLSPIASGAAAASPTASHVASSFAVTPSSSTVSPTKPSSSPSTSGPGVALSSPPPASTDNIFGLLDNDDVSDDDADGDGEGAADAGKKKKKKKKKGKKTGKDGDGQGEAEVPEAPTANGNHTNGAGAGVAAGGSSGDANDASPEASGEGATGAAKKKKKKKTKGGVDARAASAATDASTEVDGADAEVEAEEAVLPDRSSPPPPTSPEPATSLPSAPNSLTASAPPSMPASAPISKAASRALFVDLVEDFGEDKIGSFEVGTAVAHDPLLGPVVHNALGKVQVKGEDKCLEAPSNSWCVKGLEGSSTPVSAFGIFDGHGGRMAAQYAAKQLLPLVARFAERAVGADPPSSPGQLAEEGYLTSEQGEGEADEAALERARVAAAQDALIARLPKALHAGFVECDEDVISRHKASGTTATLAVQVGWELLVANVGDSLAYLDTGSEIVVISANHRVAENPDEQERIIKAGGRIKPAKYGEDDDPADGPPGSATPHEGQQLRVWPGGINMTRTIGDEAAKGLLIAEPAVRQISLPVTGARLVIASDGLWDAVNAKTIIGQLRTCNAREAASKAAVYAMRNKKHDDDVTVVVADFVPRPGDTHVPGLLKRTSGPAAAALAALAAAGMKEERAAQSWRPLETPSETWRERHRAHRQRAAAYLRQLDLAERAEAEAEEEIERQRRMAVAPAAGTAGVGTAVRLPPVSDTYRELAELKISVEALSNMDDEPAAGTDDWTQVDAKKKKDSAGGFDMRKELMKAARPGEARQARSPSGGGGGGREERQDAGGRRERRERGGTERERRPTRRERDGASAATADTTESAAAASAVEKEALEQQQPEQQQPRGERRERGDRRDRGGRGGRGREGPAGGARSGGTSATTEGAEPGSAPAPPAPPGVVKADRILVVPRSLLTAGGAAASAAGAKVGSDDTAAAAEGSTVGAGSLGKPRRERAPRGGARNRKESAGPAAASQDGAAAGERAEEQATAAAEDGAASAISHSRRTQQKQRRREKEAVAAAAAAAAMGGLPSSSAPLPRPIPAAATAPPPSQAHVPVASSSDPVVVMEPASRHHQRRQQHPYGAPQPAPYTAPQPAQVPRDAAAVAAAHYPPAKEQQLQPQPYPPAPQQPTQQAQQQSRRPHVVAAPAPAVPTYAGPLDFGAGFGPGSSMWPPSSGGGQHGGFNAGSGAAAPQRPSGLAGGHPQRSPDEVAAAAAAAAAAAVARKAAAARGGSGSSSAQYAQGRT